MPTVVNETVAECDCPSCAKPLPVKKTPKGKLVLKCRWCDYENYATPGTIHYKNIEGKMRWLTTPAAPAPTEAAATTTTPAAAERRLVHQR